MMANVISVIIPVKNRATTIARALDSVLVQEGDFSIEIIIVDDASTDDTKRIARTYCVNFKNITLIENEESVGGAEARNKGARVSTGQYIAFLDSDDQWFPDHLKRKLTLLATQSAQGSFGSFNIVSQNKVKPMKLPAYLADSIENFIFEKGGDTRTSTFLFMKDPFMKVLFDSNLAKHQDWDLAIRFSRKYKLAMDTKETVNIYVNVDNRMSNKNNFGASYYFLQKHQEKISNEGIYNFKLSLCFNTFRFEGRTKDFHSRLRELTVMGEKTGLAHKKKYYLLHNHFLRFFLPLLFSIKRKLS